MRVRVAGQARAPDAYRGTVRVREVRGNRYFVSSEGGSAAAAFGEARVIVSCATQADDGMPLHDSILFVAPSFDQLPREADMVAQVEALSKQLSALRKAPIVDDYAGPVVVRGTAAGRVMRALLAEGLTGTPAPKGSRPGARAAVDSELAGKVGQRILPTGVSVVDDPTLARSAGQPLTGHFAFDEDGIAARRVSLVEDGVFKRFVMSRTPRKGFEHSTGHGRSSPFSPVRAHPANLIVSTSRGVSDRELVRRALAAAKQQRLPYILAVDREIHEARDFARDAIAEVSVLDGQRSVQLAEDSVRLSVQDALEALPLSIRGRAAQLEAALHVHERERRGLRVLRRNRAADAIQVDIIELEDEGAIEHLGAEHVRCLVYIYGTDDEHVLGDRDPARDVLLLLELRVVVEMDYLPGLHGLHGYAVFVAPPNGSISSSSSFPSADRTRSLKLIGGILAHLSTGGAWIA